LDDLFNILHQIFIALFCCLMGRQIYIPTGTQGSKVNSAFSMKLRISVRIIHLELKGSCKACEFCYDTWGWHHKDRAREMVMVIVVVMILVMDIVMVIDTVTVTNIVMFMDVVIVMDTVMFLVMFVEILDQGAYSPINVHNLFSFGSLQHGLHRCYSVTTFAVR
ncbi:hypothetical protein STEG23_015294, partial [Scotinomys teguina]